LCELRIGGVLRRSLPASNIQAIAKHTWFGGCAALRAWQEAFATFTGPFDYEIHELNVTTEAALAFVHSLNHVKAMLASGQITELWLRWTACLRRIDGVWLIVHDHVSVPADLEHGQAVVNLRP
jgi:ketosteroid isomerase-like protein